MTEGCFHNSLSVNRPGELPTLDSRKPVPTLDREKEVPTLDSGGYLPWMGVPTLNGGRHTTHRVASTCYAVLVGGGCTYSWGRYLLLVGGE